METMYGYGFGNYAANFQVFGSPEMGDVPPNCQGTGASLVTRIRDGLSNTVVVAEKSRLCYDKANPDVNGGPQGETEWSVGSWPSHGAAPMAMIAYGNTTGSMGYRTNLSDSGMVPGRVGVATMFQIKPTAPLGTCLPYVAQTAQDTLVVG